MSRRIVLIFLFLVFSGIRCYRWLLKTGRKLAPYTSRIIFSSICVVFLIVGINEGWQWHQFAKTPFNSPSSTTVIIKPNTGLKQLANQLHQRGLLTHPQFFVMYARHEGYAHKIRMGEYTVDSQTTPRQLLENIVNGKVVMRKITLVEGITMRQIRANAVSQ